MPQAPAPSRAGLSLRGAWLLAGLAFVAALVSGLGVVWLDDKGHRHAKEREALTLVNSQAGLLRQRLDAAMSATYALAAVLRQNDYQVDPAGFEFLAKELLKFHPAVSSLQYAPEGITTYVVPLAGNEAAIGGNLLVESDRNKEALQAVSTRRLTLAGPFELRQGGLGIVGRLPIFEPRPGGGERFWGFSVALIRISDLLQSVNIDRLREEGYRYSLWRVHPDTGEIHSFASSEATRLLDPVTFDFEVPNGHWYLSVEPEGGWMADHRYERLFEIFLAVCFAVLVGLVVFVLLRQPARLRQQVAQRTHELAEEITVRREAEAQLRLAARVFESSVEAIMITDASERIISVNKAFSLVTGYAPDEVLGQTPALLASGRHGAPFFAAMREALARDGHWQGEVWNQRKNGEVFPQWLGISVLRDESGQVTNYVSISSDLSAQKAAEERLDYLAHHDVLTGLPNRLLLRDRLALAMANADRSGTRVSVLSLDLDRFKVINDTLGHHCGDLLLQQVVTRLKQVVRGADTISRQGGDEFIIIAAAQVGVPESSRIAVKIQERLAEPFIIDGHEVRVTSSIGISLYPDDGNDLETLLKKCDIAMYHAKESGRATYRFYTEALNEHATERLQLEAELTRAIERGDFVLYYQPQIDLETGLVVGAEALIRWRHPEKGMVPPGRFIPLAEESGLIVPIGDWVLGEACRQAAVWQAEGLPPLTVSINLSGLQFRRPGLVAQVEAVLKAVGLAPANLELEMTESILIQDAEQVLQTVRELKALGVKLAIDDFGTGYSSLSYLKRFAVDKLKIDQSFIREVCSNPEDAAIVRAVIQLGRSLNLETIAEGAETAEQIQHLRDNGCYQVQGYFYSKPLPTEEFASYVRQVMAEAAALTANG